MLKKRTYKPNEIIIKENSLSSYMYFLYKGNVKIYNDNKFLREFNDYACFGEISIIKHIPHTATVISNSKSSVYLLSREDFFKIMDKNMLKYIKERISWMDNFHLKWEKLYMVKQWGKGQFGSVSWVHDNHKWYAIKQVSKVHAEKNKIWTKYFQREREILLKINHPFIIKLIKTFKDNKNIYYWMQFVNGCELSKYLTIRKEINFNEEDMSPKIKISNSNAGPKKRLDDNIIKNIIEKPDEEEDDDKSWEKNYNNNLDKNTNTMLDVNNIKITQSNHSIKCNTQNTFQLSLFNNFKTTKQMLIESRKYETQFYIGSLLLVLQYLNSKMIIHRDIKPENIMINKNGYITWIDFNTSTEIKDITSTMAGTPYYISPEILMGKGYGLSVDYWSVGVVAFKMFYGHLPFGNDSNDPIEIYKDIIRCKVIYPEIQNTEVKNFISSWLKKNVYERSCNLEWIKKDKFYTNSNFNWDGWIDLKLSPPYLPQLKIKKKECIIAKGKALKFINFVASNELINEDCECYTENVNRYNEENIGDKYNPNWCDDF